MDKRIMKGFAVVLLAAILISIPIGCLLYKPSIHNATYKEITEVYDIGNTLSYRILEYLVDNPECEIDDLIYVDGIGPVRLKALKGEFR